MDAAVRHADGDSAGRCGIRSARCNVGETLECVGSLSYSPALLCSPASLARRRGCSPASRLRVGTPTSAQGTRWRPRTHRGLRRESACALMSGWSRLAGTDSPTLHPALLPGAAGVDQVPEMRSPP